MYFFLFFFFFFNDTATTEIYTLSLHDALPIFPPEEVTRVPTGSSPPAASRTPFLVISSTSRSISATSLSSGGSAFEVVIRNRIVVSLALPGRPRWPAPADASNRGRWNRHLRPAFFSTIYAPDVETGPAAPVLPVSAPRWAQRVARRRA